MTRFHVIIPAAGTGSRMQADIPKQYLLLNGKPLIQHVVEVFEQSPRISSIQVILSPHDPYWPGLTGNKLQVHRTGGETRSATVLNGLHALQETAAADDWVLVHDAARPGLTAELLSDLLEMLEDDEVGGLLALPLADTLKRAGAEQRVAATVPRSHLWQAQTPQMFRYAVLKKALETYQGTPTDEAEAVEALGLSPKLITGELRNLKVTYPQDLTVLAAILNQVN